MRILLINNCVEVLNCWKREMKKAFSEADIALFYDPLLAIKRCLQKPPQMIFTALAMRPQSGPDVVKMLRKRYPDIKYYIICDSDTDDEGAKRPHIAEYIYGDLTAEKLLAIGKNAARDKEK